MDKARKRHVTSRSSLAKIVMNKSKTPKPGSPPIKPVRQVVSTSKKQRPQSALKSAHLQSHQSFSPLHPQNVTDSRYIEQALRKSIELLEVVQALNFQKQVEDLKHPRSSGVSPGSTSPISERRTNPMCNSSTQTTEDKSTQVSITSPTFRGSQNALQEMRELKQSLQAVTHRLKDMSSPYLKNSSSGTEGILTFRSPDRESFSGKRTVFTSSINGPLLSEKKHGNTSPSDTPQGLHLSSLESGTLHGSREEPPLSDEKKLLDIMDELELS